MPACRGNPGEAAVGGVIFKEGEVIREISKKIGPATNNPEALEKAMIDLMPHHICTYLYELAQTFNRFYEKSRVVGDDREALRVQLVALYADVLKDGLSLLSITAPERL